MMRSSARFMRSCSRTIERLHERRPRLDRYLWPRGEDPNVTLLTYGKDGLLKRDGVIVTAGDMAELRQYDVVREN